MTASAPGPRSRPRSTRTAALATVIALVAAMLVPVVATVPRAEAAIPSSLPSDQSGQLPVTERGEAVGDFMGRGSSQRAVIENTPDFGSSNLNVYDPEERGGALLRSTPAPWKPWITPYTWNFGVVNGWLPFKGGLDTVAMVWTPEGVYIGGHNFSTADTVVFRANPDGTCAQPSCATGPTNPTGWVNSTFPTVLSNTGDPYADGVSRHITVSSLAAGTIGSTPVLAVGLSDFGVWILNRTTGQQIGQPFTGCATAGIKTQTPRPRWPGTRAATAGWRSAACRPRSGCSPSSSPRTARSWPRASTPTSRRTSRTT